MHNLADKIADKLVAIGERSTVAPFSLLFSEELDALDVRVWLCMSGMYHENHMLNMELLAQKLNVEQTTLLDSLFVLTVHRWFVWDVNQGIPEGLPQVSTSKMSVEDVAHHGSGKYMDFLKFLAEHGKERRARAEAQKVLTQMGENMSKICLN